MNWGTSFRSRVQGSTREWCFRSRARGGTRFSCHGRDAHVVERGCRFGGLAGWSGWGCSFGNITGGPGCGSTCYANPGGGGRRGRRFRRFARWRERGCSFDCLARTCFNFRLSKQLLDTVPPGKQMLDEEVIGQTTHTGAEPVPPARDLVQRVVAALDRARPR